MRGAGRRAGVVGAAAAGWLVQPRASTPPPPRHPPHMAPATPHPLPPHPHRFSAFLAKGIVDDLTGYYDPAARKFYAVRRRPGRGAGREGGAGRAGRERQGEAGCAELVRCNAGRRHACVRACVLACGCWGAMLSHPAITCQPAPLPHPPTHPPAPAAAGGQPGARGVRLPAHRARRPHRRAHRRVVWRPAVCAQKVAGAALLGPRVHGESEAAMDGLGGGYMYGHAGAAGAQPPPPLRARRELQPLHPPRPPPWPLPGPLRARPPPPPTPPLHLHLFRSSWTSATSKRLMRGAPCW